MGNRVRRKLYNVHRKAWLRSTMYYVRCTVLVFCFGSLVCSPWSCNAAERIVSLNACTDELLLQLADPNQIAGVTRFDHSPKSTELLSRNPQIKKLSSDVESIIGAQSSVVLAGPFSNSLLLNQLQEQGVNISMVSVPKNWDELLEVSDQIIGFTNQSGKLEVFKKAIEELRQLSRNSKWKGKTAVFWSAAGHVSGLGTFEDTILATLGMKNGAQFEGYAFLSLEKLIQLQPDVVVVTQKENQKDSWTHDTLFHPALKQALPDLEYLQIPEGSTSCASSYTVEVLKNILNETPKVAERNLEG